MQARVECLSTVLREALTAKRQAGVDKLDVGALLERVVDDALVFLDCNGTCRVDEVPAGFRVGVNAVDSAKDELFLEVGEESEVTVRLRKGCQYALEAEP